MHSKSPIKACLFDVGGVCVLSPMLAINGYEEALEIPRGYLNYAISKSPWWHNLERGETPPDAAFFSGFTSDLASRQTWESFHRSRKPPLPLPPSGHPPAVNGEHLFRDMMRKSRVPDPYFPAAITRLRATGKYKLAALTNDHLPRPPAAAAADGDGDGSNHPIASEIRSLFDDYISSSECGMRKPERRIFQLALSRLGVHPHDVVFLDDIGANCKAARELGMRTIKVPLEDTWRAVRELEEVTGEVLLPGGGDPPPLPPPLPLSGKSRL